MNVTFLSPLRLAFAAGVFIISLVCHIHGTQKSVIENL